jgi:apolipoprotein N-acyltransferase
VSNTGIVWDPVTGPGERYVKRHPVPFGEYIPMRSLVRRVTSKVDLVPRDFVAGTRVGVLDVGPVRVGDVICFEVAYDDLVRDVVDRGREAARRADQQRDVRPQRGDLPAAGHGPPAGGGARPGRLVAATSGISAVIAPDGRLVRSAPVFTREVLSAPVPTRSGTTLATRVGRRSRAAAVGLAVAAAAAGVAVGRRARP